MSDSSPPDRDFPFCEAQGVRLLAMDCDGVLTDGSIWLTDDGHELKRFSARDGYGVRLWTDAGYQAAIVTGRGGAHVKRRAEELGIEHVFERVGDKAEFASRLAAATGVGVEAIAYIGDDWPDIRLMNKVGFPAAPADAEPPVIEAAAWTSTRKGGHGAVRELAEHLLREKGELPSPGAARTAAGPNAAAARGQRVR
ncbi:MAG: HAD hydrolase family protein [Planctomycetota bacterium]